MPPIERGAVVTVVDQPVLRPGEGCKAHRAAVVNIGIKVLSRATVLAEPVDPDSVRDAR